MSIEFCIEYQILLDYRQLMPYCWNFSSKCIRENNEDLHSFFQHLFSV